MRGTSKAVSRGPLASTVPSTRLPTLDACATHTTLLLPPRLRFLLRLVLELNMLVVPKPPVLSPSAAALLSVCFKFHPTITTIVLSQLYKFCHNKMNPK